MFVFNEGIVVTVFLVGFMLLTAHLMPSLAVVGEEGIGLRWRIVNLGQAKAVGLVDEILVKTGTTYNKDVLVRTAGDEKLIPRGKTLAAFQLLAATCQHTVATIGQRTLGQAIESLATHEDSVARGQRLETFQIVGQPVYKLVLIAYGTVASHGGNHSDSHIGNRFDVAKVQNNS